MLKDAKDHKETAFKSKTEHTANKKGKNKW